MATPVEFKYCNATIQGGEEVNDLPAFTDDTLQKNVVTCWELSDEEMMDIVKTKRIYLHQLTYGNPIIPMLITTECPVKDK